MENKNMTREEFNAKVQKEITQIMREVEINIAHDDGEDCCQEKCQTCCNHDERDHGICLDCEHEQDPGEAIDAAMARFEDR
jgi:hypothetical protein